MENLKKKSGKSNKLRTVYPKNHENFIKSESSGPILLVLIKGKEYIEYLKKILREICILKTLNQNDVIDVV